MCKYCKVDGEPFIDFVTDGNLEIRTYGFISGDKYRGRALNVSLDVCGTEVISQEIDIEYCPMCGRKLNENV